MLSSGVSDGGLAVVLLLAGEKSMGESVVRDGFSSMMSFMLSCFCGFVSRFFVLCFFFA